jgi:hypothetical protein
MDRLAELEAKAAALNAEIAALKAGAAAPPPPPKDEGARVVMLNDERRDLPNLDQMRKLFSIVRHKAPQVKGADDDAAFRGFCGAFRYVSNCGRIAAPNDKYALGYWFDDMAQWLRQRNATTMDITGSSFIAAVLASGDVQFTEHNPALGHVWKFAIAPPNHGGRPASDAWKRVLEGSVLPPVPPMKAVDDRSIGYRKVLAPSW